ncbi:MAG: helix-turn-helix domain-containing protein [Varibaculum sp.]|nr:helix-turn-helix domain-containing protein [Varibaculum sp.]
MANPARTAGDEVGTRALNAATEIYAKRGWDSLTFDAVARRARVGKSSLYSRWPGKKELLRAALSRFDTRMAGVETLPIAQVLYNHGINMARQLRSGAGVALTRLALDAYNIRELEDLNREILQTPRRETVATLQKRLDSSYGKGIYSADFMVLTVESVVHGYVFHSHTQPITALLEQMTKSLIANPVTVSDTRRNSLNGNAPGRLRA